MLELSDEILELSDEIFNVENIIKLIDTDGDYDLLNKLYPNRKSFCDDEIMDYEDPNLKFKEYNWDFIDNKYEKCSIQKEICKFTLITKFEFTLNKFKFDDNVLIAVKITRLHDNSSHDDNDEIIGLLTPNHVIIVSSLMGHPKIETNDMIYYNSDGSFFDELIEDINDPEGLTRNLFKYYKKFLNDEYH